MLVTTTFELSGWEIQRVCGEVFGLTVRSRNVFSQMGAGFKSMFGGELQGMTKNLTDSRNEAMTRMLEAARAKGGNAVVGFRFDTSELGETWSEICAYGTAVVAVPVDDGARQTATELGYGQPGPPPTTPDPVQPQYQQPQQYQQGQYQQPYEQSQQYPPAQPQYPQPPQQ
jgi:uncharacterized protein YbjQ (UPF0145 family)